MKRSYPGEGGSFSKEREAASHNDLPPINDQIRYPRVQVITQTGDNAGVLTRYDALRMAHEANLDLVLLSDRGAEGLPVVKIMDFGKALYAKKKKQAEAKKHQKVIQIKEIKMRPKIGEHDYQTKINQAVEFLQDGKKLKVTLMFKGREVVLSQEQGKELFDKIDRSFEEAGLRNIVQEKDSRMGTTWSRMYYLKK